MGLHTVRTKPGQMVRERSVDGRFVALSRVPSTTCRTRGRRSRVLVVYPDGDDAAISFLAFEIYDVPHESSSISCSPVSTSTVTTRRSRFSCSRSTMCRTRVRRSRVLVVHAEGDDAAISFLVLEIYDVPHESSSISCSRSSTPMAPTRRSPFSYSRFTTYRRCRARHSQDVPISAVPGTVLPRRCYPFSRPVFRALIPHFQALRRFEYSDLR